MPDRAVVDEYTAFHAGYDEGFGDRYYEHEDPEGAFRRWKNADPPIAIPDPAPRAMCAVSEDRQWLVVLDPLDIFWMVHRWHPIETIWVQQRPAIKDTGQDAHAVLAAFLEGRG